MSSNKTLARHLYLVDGKTIKEIAQQLGISQSTIYSWQHQYAWKKLKSAITTAPATICENFSSQLVELQNKIKARQAGNRIPTIEEAEISRKLAMSIAGIKTKQTLAQYMQMIESFKDFVRPLSTQFSRQLASFADKFINSRSRNGYAPWQLEYGAEELVAISPFYDELEADEPCDKENPPAYREPCTVIHQCKLQTGCKWPDCRHHGILPGENDTPQPDDPWPLHSIQLPSDSPLTPENSASKIQSTENE